MTDRAQHSGQDPRVDNASGHEADAETRRLAAIIMVIFALLLMTLTWFSNEVSMTHASSAVAPALAADPTQPAQYLPRGYVNQATQAEEHIQAF